MVIRDAPGGTVVQSFGRYLAGRVDMLTTDRFKTTVPIDAISPFSVAAEFEPATAAWATFPRVTDRLRTDLLKNLAERLQAARADFLVVDNTSATLPVAEINGGFYTMIGGESTDFMDHYWNSDPDGARQRLLRPADEGFTDRWRKLYERFVAQCLEAFPAERIILVRSHVARFVVGEDGRTTPVPNAPRVARFLALLDEHFVRISSCTVSDAISSFFPLRGGWHSLHDDARVELERDIRRLCLASPSTSHRGAVPGRRRRRRDVEPTPAAEDLAHESQFFGDEVDSAADHIAGLAAGRGKLNERWLRRYFRLVEATPNDLIALTYLDGDPELRRLVADCVRAAVSDRCSYPSSETRGRYERNVAALATRVDARTRRALATPAELQIVLRLGHGRFVRFGADGRIGFFTTATELDVEALGSDKAVLGLEMVEEAVRSWPFYLERGRRGVTAAPVVQADSPQELVDSCYWLDWQGVFDEESIHITTAASPWSWRLRRRPAKVDLSFLFRNTTRMASVTGGMMDQLKQIACFADACEQAGVEAYYDDLIYLHTRIHDGYVASWFNSSLDDRRFSSHLSSSLANRFREQAQRTTKTWLWVNAFTLVSLGLVELAVYTPQARLESCLADAPSFPVLVYRSTRMERDVLKRATPGVALFVGQAQAGGRDSAPVLQKVFDFAALPLQDLDERSIATRERLCTEPTVALHVRRGDYVRHDLPGWHGETDHYREAVEFVARAEEFSALRPLNLLVFSDDPAFVREHSADLGLDLADSVVIVDWNKHLASVYDAYLMSFCPVIIGSVGAFAATTSLLSRTPNFFVRAAPEGPELWWGPDSGASPGSRSSTGPLNSPGPDRRPREATK